MFWGPSLIVINNLGGGVGELPFYNTTNYDMININGTDRTNLIEKFENNGYIEFFRTHRNDLPAHINPAYRKQYYDIDEFNIKFSRLKCGLTVCHVNIRRIAKNKPKLLAFLSTITRKFDVILLSEIGDNAKHFLKVMWYALNPIWAHF